MSWKKRALLNFLLYSVDVAIAIAGMSFGFGIHVENWWALLGLMLVSRWVFNTVHNAMLFADAERRAARGADVNG
jgi:hypothetical protein